MSYRFKAPLDKLSFWISNVIVSFAIVLIIIGLLSWFKIITIPAKGHTGEQIPGLILFSVGLLLFVIFGIVYMFKPVYYQIDEEGIHVHRGVGIYTIDKTNILRVHKADDFKIFRTLRLFGSGGLFGYTGLFYNSKYGQIRMMATQLKNFVIIYTLNNRTLVLTPDDAEAFMDACQKSSIVTG